MQEFAQRITTAPIFKNCIFAIILLAAALIGLETSHSIMARHGPQILMLDAIILWIFTAEAALKMAAHGRRPWLYFKDPWNCLDFAVVAVCWIPSPDAHIAAVLRLARVLRILRVVSALPKLQLLVGALLKSLPSMGYVSLLLLLHFYMYAVVGVFLFREGTPETFGSLGTALLTLFQIITLEGWAEIMASQTTTHPIAAPFYYITFILFGTMIMLNLFIGVIMNGMTEAHEEQVAAEHRKERGRDRVADELRDLERSLKATSEQLAQLRRALDERKN